MSERGGATLFAVACAGLLLILGSALGVVSAIVVAHRTAQSAADLAALAGATAVGAGGDGCGRAADVAVRNGALVDQCTVVGLEVSVQVVVAGPDWLTWSGDLAGRARAGPARDHPGREPRRGWAGATLSAMTLRAALHAVLPTRAEVVDACPGDDIVPRPDVVMDRGFSLAAPPVEVWPWIEQLGKARAGWYLPTGVERAVPPARRGLRAIDGRWLGLAVGDVIPDYGGRHATFEVAEVDPPRALVYRSSRGDSELSWALVLSPVLDASTTRVWIRLRVGGVKRPGLARRVGGAFDLLTIAGLAAGLNERVSRPAGR